MRETTDRWYVVHARPNFEPRVAESIQGMVTKDSAVKEVLIPTEKVMETRKGKPREVERSFMPGYVLVRMDMNPVSYHEVLDQQYVIGFLGPQGSPSPLPQNEVEQIQGKIREAVDSPKPSITYLPGEEVQVIDGPFESFTGQVEEVNEENRTLKVTVSIFSRPTPVELEYSQVKKVD